MLLQRNIQRAPHCFPHSKDETISKRFDEPCTAANRAYQQSYEDPPRHELGVSLDLIVSGIYAQGHAVPYMNIYNRQGSATEATASVLT